MNEIFSFIGREYSYLFHLSIGPQFLAGWPVTSFFECIYLAHRPEPLLDISCLCFIHIEVQILGFLHPSLFPISNTLDNQL